MNTIDNFLEDFKECAYTPTKLSNIRYRYMPHCDEKANYEMLIRGWRRFGLIHFKPECKTCDDCKTIRIDTREFKFKSSHKRILNKNKDIKVYIQKPSVSFEHIELFNKYHNCMSEKKDWNPNQITPADYKASYVDGANSYGKEILYVLDNKLICVALCDILPDGISAVYCYYDHDYQNRSLGKFSILLQIKMALQSNIPYLFLGHWIKDHYSMGYKEDYAPFDILKNRPNLDEKCIWERYEKQ